MSIEESLAARRLTRETLCWSDDVERKLMLILYAPCELLLHSVAAAWNEPDGSGKTYQLSVTGPLPDEPHADRSAVAAAVARTAVSRVPPIPKECLLSTLSFPI